MTRKIKANDNKRISFYSVNFEIERSTRTGVVNFSCEIYDSKGVELANGKMSAPLLTAWVDENNMNMAKCHFLLPITSKNRTKAKLARHILEVLIKGGPQRFGPSDFDITANSDGLCIMAVRNGTQYSHCDKISYKPYKALDNKAAAIQQLIDDMKSYGITVGGTKLIDFSILSDDVLIEIGFETIPDQVGKGLPMWRYPNLLHDALQSRDDYYSYGENKRRAIQEVCNQILDIISQSLKAA